MLVPVVLSFSVAFAALALLVGRFSRLALDQPNDRSLHEQPVPRTGGIAVLIGCAAGVWLASFVPWVPLFGALCLAVLSFADDLYGLSAGARLSVHLIVASVVSWFLMTDASVAAILAASLAVAWITNLYNFMDGSDGLAGGMALIGFSAFAAAAFSEGNAGLASVCASLAAAAGAFLLFNFHPAKIFLGDVGSVPLGFLAGSLGIAGWRSEIWPLWFPVLVFSPFIADASFTLAKRLVRGQRVWQAHREHYYQRMVRMGLGHRRTALISYAAMVACAGLALLSRDSDPASQALAFAAGIAILAAIGTWVDIRWARGRMAP